MSGLRSLLFVNRSLLSEAAITVSHMAITKKSATSYRCSECGWTAIKWVGRCGECQAWGTVAEVGAVIARTPPATVIEQPAVPIGSVDLLASAAVPTGVGEFDRVLGGGLVPGSVVLVAGEPGIGKSTLLLDVSARVARCGQRALYVSGEESAGQVRSRAERIDAVAPELYLASETDLATVLAQIDAVSPSLLVVDSVQTVASSSIEGAAGNVSQVREVAASIISVAKKRGIAVLLIGHVTKDGSIAGPRTLEHLVDVVIQFEGERHSRLRLVRAVKNRFGATDEVGCFDLTDEGIVGLPDPSGLFLSHGDRVAGSCVTVALEGRRPLVTEVQSLLVKGNGGSPRRTVSGIESARVAMILAVLTSRVRLPLGDHDSYISTVGGAQLREPAADLAVALAVASASLDRPLGKGVVAFGEVGLSGEVRPVGGVERRVAEAARIGFDHAIVPAGSMRRDRIPSGVKVTEADHLFRALAVITG